MATNFPTSADDAATVGGDSKPAAGTALSDSTAGHPSHSDLHENVGDAVQAVEAKVGTGSSAPAANTVLTGTGSGTSGWATVSTAMIGDDQVTAAKIHDDAVTKVVVTDTADATCFPALFESATGSLTPETDAGLTYNASNATLTATTFVGALTGNASGSSGSCTGNAATATLASTVTVADAGSDATLFPLLATDGTGSEAVLADASALTYNASNGTLSATSLAGTLTTATQDAITSVGTLDDLIVDGDVDINGLVKVDDGSAAAPTFTFDSDEGNGMYLSETDTVSVATAGSVHLQIGGSVTPNDVITRATGTFKTIDSGSQFPTGSGTAAHIITGFGLSAVVKNSSVAADKENVSTDLGSHLTAGMIDSVVPKMWNRITAPGYPEIGPIADDMETISEFLASHGTDANGDQILMGVDTTAWMSLMTLALQDIRTRLAALEG